MSCTNPLQIKTLNCNLRKNKEFEVEKPNLNQQQTVINKISEKYNVSNIPDFKRLANLSTSSSLKNSINDASRSRHFPIDVSKFDVPSSAA